MLSSDLLHQPRSRLHISDHDFAKSERLSRGGERFFLFIFKLLGLVSIEIFTSKFGNLCSLFYTDHFLTIVEILLTKQVILFLFTKDLACLYVVNVIKMAGWPIMG